MPKLTIWFISLKLMCSFAPLVLFQQFCLYWIRNAFCIQLARAHTIPVSTSFTILRQTVLWQWSINISYFIQGPSQTFNVSLQSKTPEPWVLMNCDYDNVVCLRSPEQDIWRIFRVKPILACILITTLWFIIPLLQRGFLSICLYFIWLNLQRFARLSPYFSGYQS